MAKKQDTPKKKVSLTDKIKSSNLKSEAHETRKLASQQKSIGEAQIKSKKKDPKRHVVGKSSGETSTGHKTGRYMTTDKIPFGKERVDYSKDLERKARGYDARAQTLNPNANIYGVKKKKK